MCNFRKTVKSHIIMINLQQDDQIDEEHSDGNSYEDYEHFMSTRQEFLPFMFASNFLYAFTHNKYTTETVKSSEFLINRWQGI